MTVFIASLPDRAVIEIKGEDTLPFLQDLVTANVADLQPGQAVHSALLTPQGKILFDFFILAVDGGVLVGLRSARRCRSCTETDHVPAAPGARHCTSGQSGGGSRLERGGPVSPE